MTDRRTTLDSTIEHVRAIMHECSLCPRRCGVDRLAGEIGVCGTPYPASVFYDGLLVGEELALSPSYEVFLTGCNMSCCFCYVDGGRPDDVQVRRLMDLRDAIRSSAARSLSFIGGEPTASLLGVLEFLRDAGSVPTVVWNTNLYMSPEVPWLLEGIVEVYVADLHFGPGPCAASLARVERYFEAATQALTEAAARTDVIVRHLLLPGHLDCCFGPIARWMKTHLPTVPLRILGNYSSATGERVTDEQVRAAQRLARQLGVTMYRDDGATRAVPIRRATSGADVDEEIVIEADGSVYIEHLTPDLLDVAVALAPDDADLRRRAAAFPPEEGAP